MRKSLLLILFLLIHFLSRAQNYQSLFGNSSTTWNYAIMPIDAVFNDSIVFQKDTVVNDTTWKKVIINHIGSTYSEGLFFEDVIAGKVWYKPLLLPDTSTVLAFDFSLSLGESFNINNGWKNYTAAERIVDSVYVLNGRKHIRFAGTIGWGTQVLEHVTFIEGIGSNIGPVYKDPSQKNAPVYLLCHSKDGIYHFKNTFFQGNCWVEVMDLEDVAPANNVNVYPTLFNDVINIENKSSSTIISVEIFSMSGRRIFHSAFSGRIYLPTISSGIYMLVMKTSKGNIITRKVARGK